MLYGLPAIVSDHPGCKQLLQNSEYLIPNDQKQLENKIVELLTTFSGGYDQPTISVHFRMDNPAQTQRFVFCC